MLLKREKYVLLALLLVFSTLCLPVVFSDRVEFAAAKDERNAHYPLIKSFSTQLPRPDLTDYSVPQTPLFHLLMGVVALTSDSDLTILRLVNLLISLGALWLSYLIFRPVLEWRVALLAVATLALSPFFFGPATRLMTDNLSLLWVFGSLHLLKTRPDSSNALVLAGLLITLAVATRQTNIWLVVLAFTVVTQGTGRILYRRPWPSLFLLVLPCITLGSFVFTWGGLVPPSKQGFWGHDAHHIVNLNAFFFCLALLGCYGSFYVFQYRRLYRTHSGQRFHIYALVLSSWLALSLFPLQVVQTVPPGPLSQVAGLFPPVFGTSLLHFVLVPLGSVYLYVSTLAARANGDTFLLRAYVIWLLFGFSYTIFYQRYFEVFTLLFLLYYVLQPNLKTRWAWAGPASLATAFLIVDIIHHLAAPIS